MPVCSKSDMSMFGLLFCVRKFICETYFLHAVLCHRTRRCVHNMFVNHYFHFLYDECFPMFCRDLKTAAGIAEPLRPLVLDVENKCVCQENIIFCISINIAKHPSKIVLRCKL